MTHRNDLVPSNAEAITPTAVPAKSYVGLYVGTGGTVVIVTSTGDEVTFSGVPSGTILPILNRGCVETVTTATNIVGF